GPQTVCECRDSRQAPGSYRRCGRPDPEGSATQGKCRRECVLVRAIVTNRQWPPRPKRRLAHQPPQGHPLVAPAGAQFVHVVSAEHVPARCKFQRALRQIRHFRAAIRCLPPVDGQRCRFPFQPDSRQRRNARLQELHQTIWKPAIRPDTAPSLQAKLRTMRAANRDVEPVKQSAYLDQGTPAKRRERCTFSLYSDQTAAGVDRYTCQFRARGDGRQRAVDIEKERQPVCRTPQPRGRCTEQDTPVLVVAHRRYRTELDLLW